jgi:hypothetical protein
MPIQERILWVIISKPRSVLFQAIGGQRSCPPYGPDSTGDTPFDETVNVGWVTSLPTIPCCRSPLAGEHYNGPFQARLMAPERWIFARKRAPTIR